MIACLEKFSVLKIIYIYINVEKEILCNDSNLRRNSGNNIWVIDFSKSCGDKTWCWRERWEAKAVGETDGVFKKKSRIRRKSRDGEQSRLKSYVKLIKAKIRGGVLVRMGN